MSISYLASLLPPNTFDTLAVTLLHGRILSARDSWCLLIILQIGIGLYQSISGAPATQLQVGPVQQYHVRGRASGSAAAPSNSSYHPGIPETLIQPRASGANGRSGDHPRDQEELLPTRAGHGYIAPRGRTERVSTLHNTAAASKRRLQCSSLPYRSEAHPADKTLTQPLETLFVLLIGVNDGDVTDPEHDLAALKTAFGQTGAGIPVIRFTSLAGDKATLENIKGWLIWLDLEAASGGSRVFVVLSGRGDTTNRMRLLENFVGEDDIHNCLSNARARSGVANPKPVTIIFDICREGRDPPSIGPSQVVNFVWTCSLGQRAHAIGFESAAVPRSCFWLALFRACKNLDSDPEAFQRTLQHRLDELGSIVLYSYNYWSRVDCPGESGEICHQAEPQVPEGTQAGWEDVYSFAALISKNFNNSASMIDALCRKQMMLCGFPVVNDTLADVTRKHMRGATQPVSQAEA